jgi:G3E family GTPase
MTKIIPYTVLGGYLGAGKTTLLNNLLRDNRGLRIAVLVNDFGDINIDTDLITSHDGETINLANGCVCCSLADGFMVALNEISRRADAIDHVIVEASGVSDPVKLGQYGTMLNFELEGVIVLADAEQVRAKAANKYVGDIVVRQLRGADLLVLNKVDLVSPKRLAEVRAWLAKTAPGVRVIESSYGRLPLSVLIGVHAPGAGAHDEHEHDHDHDHDHQHMYRTWSLRRREPLSRAALEALMAELPEGVLRAKGFVYLAEDPDRRQVLQRVGRRWTLTPAGLWGEAERGTTLVFIGVNDDATGIEIDRQFGAKLRARDRIA